MSARAVTGAINPDWTPDYWSEAFTGGFGAVVFFLIAECASMKSPGRVREYFHMWRTHHTALHLYCLVVNLNFWRASEQGCQFGNLLLVRTTRLETSLICLTVPETDSHNRVTRTVD